MKKEDHIIPGHQIQRFGYYWRGKSGLMWVTITGPNKLGDGKHWYNQKDYMYIKMDPKVISDILSKVDLRVRRKRSWYHVVGFDPRKE